MSRVNIAAASCHEPCVQTILHPKYQGNRGKLLLFRVDFNAYEEGAVHYRHSFYLEIDYWKIIEALAAFVDNFAEVKSSFVKILQGWVLT